MAASSSSRVGLRRRLFFGTRSAKIARQRFIFVRWLRQFVHDPSSFAAAELLLPGTRAVVRPRETPIRIHYRRCSPDLDVIAEVFGIHNYALPDGVLERLRGLGRPARIVDLGAHIGVFGAFMYASLPDAEMVSWEPDPANAELLTETIEDNGLSDRWRLVPAAAGAHDGTMRFVDGRGTESHAVTGDDAAPGGLEVPVRDVFPDLLDADLIKMDIEGSEWPLLTDERFQQLTAIAIVLEHHDDGCPDPDPKSLAEKMLRRSGFDPSAVTWEADNMPHGLGVMWGVRPPAAA